MRITNKIHIAISTDKIAETVKEYSERLGVDPCSYITNEYALWRTESVNMSVRQDASCKPGELRHLGWEDETVTEFSQDDDVNGITWERFNSQLQADEINESALSNNYLSPIKQLLEPYQTTT